MSEEENPQGADRRKYQRVQFEASPQTLQVEVEGHGPTIVFDMSFSGAALAQPTNKKVVTTGETLTLQLKTKEIEATVESSVVRCTDRVVAVQFVSVSSDARRLVDSLISDRMIGLNMNLIDPEHYSPSSTFQYWFHGPKETNLFLWQKDGGQLEKAQFDLNNVMLVFEDDMFFYENKNEGAPGPNLNHQQILQKAQSILTQMHTNLDSLNGFKTLIDQQLG